MKPAWNILIVVVIFINDACAWNTAMENPNLYGGDMVLSPEQVQELYGNGSYGYGSHNGRRWPNKRIPYQIQNGFGNSGRRAIMDGIEEYHKKTCLRFVPWKGERAYVSFVPRGGCSSPVGYESNSWNKQRNDVTLGPGCQNKGTVIHELGHSIGLYHEQNRKDRDQYVTIHRNNIQDGMLYNFRIENAINSLGTPYDFKSIMHYGAWAFAKNRNYYTITAKDSANQYYINHNDNVQKFSEWDVKQINLMYKCDDSVVTPKTVTPPVGHGCSYSHDKDVKCGGWARTGYCSTKNQEYEKIMKDKCCNACKHYIPCLDSNTNCPGWAANDQCRKNPDFMLNNCFKSCQQC